MWIGTYRPKEAKKLKSFVKSIYKFESMSFGCESDLNFEKVKLEIHFRFLGFSSTSVNIISPFSNSARFFLR